MVDYSLGFLAWAIGLVPETHSLYTALKTAKAVDPIYDLCEKCRHQRRNLFDRAGTVQSVYPILLWVVWIIAIALWPARLGISFVRWVRGGFKRKHSCLREYRRKHR